MIPAGCCLLHVVGCSLSAACCLVDDPCCSLSAACCLLDGACCMVPAARWSLAGCLLPAACLLAFSPIAAEQCKALCALHWNRTVHCCIVPWLAAACCMPFGSQGSTARPFAFSRGAAACVLVAGRTFHGACCMLHVAGCMLYHAVDCDIC